MAISWRLLQGLARQSQSCLRNPSTHFSRSLSYIATDDKNLKWRIVSANVVERYPMVVPDLEQWEIDYFEMRDELDKYRLQELPTELFGEGIYGPTEEEIRTAEEDDMLTHKDEYVPASRISKDDIENNRKSLYRAFPKHLYLIVKKNRKEHAWQFPQGGRQENETMREAAMRELAEECGKKMELNPLGNGPIGYMQYELPEADQKKFGCFGTKVFFYRTQYISGSISLKKEELEDYLWVTKEELPEYLSPELNKCAQDLLFE